MLRVAVRRSVWVGVLVLVTGMGRAGEAQAGAAALTGYWVHEANHLKITVGFVPDGRYFIEYRGGQEAPTYERGRYRVGDGTLSFEAPGEGVVTYGCSLAGNTLTLTGGLFPDGGAFAKQPGSEATVVEDVRRFDEAKERDDAAWRAKISVGPLTGGRPAQTAAVGEITADPNPARCFPNATVFNEQQVYFSIDAPQELAFEDGTRRTVTGHWHWYFQANGRVFVHALAYLPGGPAEGRVLRAWGRYRIQAGGKEEPLVVESDEGEQLSMTLLDGRRTMQWNGNLYPNLAWEQARQRL